MTATASIMDDVADAITRLRFLEKKSADDVQLIALLTKQKNEASQEAADAAHDFGVELFQAQQERDAALRKVRDVEIVIESLAAQALTLGNLAAKGLSRIREGDPMAVASEPNQLVKHLQAAPRPVAAVSNMETRLPPPELNPSDQPLFLRGR